MELQYGVAPATMPFGGPKAAPPIAATQSGLLCSVFDGHGPSGGQVRSLVETTALRLLRYCPAAAAAGGLLCGACSTATGPAAGRSGGGKDCRFFDCDHIAPSSSRGNGPTVRCDWR